MSELVLYTNPMSRGRIVRWLLEELNVPYQTKIVEYGPEMKSPEFLAINPMGKVPALKHGDVVITETPAICAYLADVFADKGLAPQSNEEKARYYRWLFFAAGPVEQASALIMLGAAISQEQQAFLGCGNPAQTLDTLATAVSQSTYITGERFTAADVYVASHIGYGIEFGKLEKRPEFVDYWARVSQRPARVRALEQDNALLQK